MVQTPSRKELSSRPAVLFDRFCLFSDQHLLLRDGEPVALGSRALEILIALTGRAGDLVSKDELLACAWPGLTVEDSNLRAQVALLRKALGDTGETAQFIAAVPGRGYRFVARVDEAPKANDAEIPAGLNNLPRLLSPPVGRDEAARSVLKRFDRFRLVTLVGPGGIGKTTLATLVANQVAAECGYDVCFCDLAPIRNPNLVSTVLAAALGLADGAIDPTPVIIEHLAGRRTLIILDSCELVIDATARVVEAILGETPDVRTLATSREPLRAEGESVYRLSPLELPPASAALTSQDAMSFPAVRLFVDRATSRCSDFVFDDDEAPLVADICRQLDGIPLAIELAAGRVEAFGTRGISALLDDRFRLLAGGKRTALPRHQTLQATLDWSYEALSEPEKMLLRRIGVFAGDFTLEAAIFVAGGLGMANDVPDLIASLISKSLVTATFKRSAAYYRMLDTTRAYAKSKLAQHEEMNDVMRQVSGYLGSVLDQAVREIEVTSVDDWLDRYSPHINDVRNSLDWAYSGDGDEDLGLSLTVAAIPLWYQLSSVDECLNGVRRALLSITPGPGRDARTRQIMHLYTALGLSQAFKVGFAPQAPAAFAKALELAEELDDRDGRCEALWGLWLCRIGLGEYRDSLGVAQRFVKLAQNSLDRFIGDRMISMTLFCMGDCKGARIHADKMLAHDTSAPVARSSNSVRFRFGQSVSARIQPAQLLWIQGFPDQAVLAMKQAVEAARGSGHAISTCEALGRWACPVWMHVGDLASADDAVNEMLNLAAASGLGAWDVFGRCWKGALLLRRGETELGIPFMRAALEELGRVRLFTLYNVRFQGILAEGLALSGEPHESCRILEASIRQSEEREELWCVAELHRIRGDVLQIDGADGPAIQDAYERSIEWAQRQDALSWELQANLSLCRWLRAKGDGSQAQRRLRSVYARFTEGFQTADLRAARALLSDLD